MRVAAALAGCRMALVSTGWTIPYLVSTNGRINHFSLSPCRGTISATYRQLSVSRNVHWSESPDH